MIGETNDTLVHIGGVECPSLIDTGSMISNVCESFYRSRLSRNFPLLQLDRLLRIEGGGGNLLDYLGYVEVPINIPKSTIQLWAAVLVTPDTPFNKQIPLLIGTNILKQINLANIAEADKIWKTSLDCLIKLQHTGDHIIYSLRRSQFSQMRASPLMVE